jgi:hypothetical protein
MLKAGCAQTRHGWIVTRYFYINGTRNCHIRTRYGG